MVSRINNEDPAAATATAVAGGSSKKVEKDEQPNPTMDTDRCSTLLLLPPLGSPCLKRIVRLGHFSCGLSLIITAISHSSDYDIHQSFHRIHSPLSLSTSSLEISEDCYRSLFDDSY
eukprot:scaffold69718_cov43-Attheya_sp.AAC.2